ncbi:DUF998 domain-containing protein [Micromonospora sp. WMMD964]|uniref:DUF998 domain-containing protein n=1 Tax=Micromonospora sp. WMMD964 TaxID=3016091 RepID=UPI002499AFFF|nr:DUF998 domain-containing protein [Micromonospora sp. WMMD964]WFE98610.1 DUF998 domain-containing protein [Micromonospora sp. WMMD964]
MKENVTTRRLLACGAAAGPLFVIVILVGGALQPEYRPIRQAASELALGSTGWIQITNFLVCGSLFVAFAIGIRRALRPRSAAWIAAALTGLFGVALIASGLFITDVAGQARHTWHGTVHNAAGSVVFLSLPLLTFTWALHSARRRSWIWAMTSAIAGVTMLLLIQGLAVSEYRGLYQRLTIGLGWTWITAFALHLRRTTPTHPSEAADQQHVITRTFRRGD